MKLASPPPVLSSDRATHEAGLDPVEADRHREARARRYNVVTVPAIRLLALNAIAAGVILHHWLVGPAVSQWTLTVFLAAVELYCAASWILLSRFWDRLKRRGADVRLALITVDVVVCIIATYVTGAERSWLFFLAAARLADAGIGFRAALVLGHVTPLLYVAMLWYVGQFDGRPVASGPAAVNAYTLYITSMYFAVIGRTATMLRERLVSAIRVSRGLIGQLREKSERLELSTRAATEASQTKARLLATVSHELRTPLTAIIEHTELVMEEADPEKDAAVIEDLSQVVAAARQLGGIIDGLLDVSAIEADQTLRIEDVDVADLLLEVTARSEPVAARVGSRLVVTQAGTPGLLRTDRARLQQILLLLLANAARFTAQGEVRLDVRQSVNGGGRSVLFRVSHDANAVPEDIRASLFKPLEGNGSSTPLEYDGTGADLVIAKRYADLISADLSHETRAGEGSTFTLRVHTAPLLVHHPLPGAPALERSRAGRPNGD